MQGRLYWAPCSNVHVLSNKQLPRIFAPGFSDMFVLSMVSLVVSLKELEMSKNAVSLTHGFAVWEYALIGETGGPFYGLNIQISIVEQNTI